MNYKAPIIPVIIEQHAEDAAFLWLQRNRAVYEPHYNLKDLAHLDDRVEANIDGLRIAGDDGWEICRSAMELEEPGEVFAAAVLAFETRIPERMEAVLSVAEKDNELKRALISALGWITFDIIRDELQKFLSADSAFLNYIGIAAYAIHRCDPGPVLDEFINHDDDLVRARALKAAGELGRVDLLPSIRPHLHEKEAKCRFYATWSATLLGDASTIEILTSHTTRQTAFSQRACGLAVRKMSPADALKWLSQLSQQPAFHRTAILGYGALGDPVSIPWLIEYMQTPELARPAGEAFAMITGMDIAYENMESDQPEGFAAGPTDDSDDENVDLDPDEDLPWPNPELIQNWWQENQKNFRNGTRSLCGKPVSEKHCRNVLADGFQRQRIAAALELALITPEQPLLETRASGRFQQRGLRIS